MANRMTTFKNTIRATFTNPEYIAVRDRFWGDASQHRTPEPMPDAVDVLLKRKEDTRRMVAALRRLTTEEAA